MASRQTEAKQNQEEGADVERVRITFVKPSEGTYVKVDRDGNIRANLGGGSFFLLSSLAITGCMAVLQFCSRAPEIIRAIGGK